MAGFSDYVENAVLNWLRGTAMPTPPAGQYVGLFSADPTDAAGGGTEVTTAVRTAGRVAATFSAPDANGKIANSALIDFGNAAGPATVSHFAVFDAATGGNKLWSGPLAASKSVAATDPVAFAAGALSLTSD
jgi:hypothetical protein